MFPISTFFLSGTFQAEVSAFPLEDEDDVEVAVNEVGLQVPNLGSEEQPSKVMCDFFPPLHPLLPLILLSLMAIYFNLW